jgi:hypothetical protein
MNISTTNKNVYYILKRFNSSFRLRRNPGFENPNVLSNHISDITIIKVYKRKCIYTNNPNYIRDNLVIKYQYKNNPEVISLNIPWDKYQDLLTETS